MGFCCSSWSGKCGLRKTWIRCCLLDQADCGLESIQPQATDTAQTVSCLMMTVKYCSKCDIQRQPMSLCIFLYASLKSIPRLKVRRCAWCPEAHTDEHRCIKKYMRKMCKRILTSTGPYAVLHTPTDILACRCCLFICLAVDKRSQQRVSVDVIRVSLALSTAVVLLI